jgi:outer membrane protein assembly factor BamE (lipoprotein component of BamABCDE complex)
MTQQQVAYALGTPMMSDPFGTNTWFYVFRQQPGHEDVTQQTLTLTFNSAGVDQHRQQACPDQIIRSEMQKGAQ